MAIGHWEDLMLMDKRRKELPWGVWGSDSGMERGSWAWLKGSNLVTRRDISVQCFV